MSQKLTSKKWVSFREKIREKLTFVVISHTLYQKLEVLGYISVARDIVLWYGAEQFRHLDLFRRDSQV